MFWKKSPQQQQKTLESELGRSSETQDWHVNSVPCGKYFFCHILHKYIIYRILLKKKKIT